MESDGEENLPASSSSGKGLIAKLADVASRSAAAISGGASLDRPELVLTAGRLLQATFSRRFMKSLAKEFARLEDLGRIKPDYLSTEQGSDCLRELLESLEKDPPDQQRMEVLRHIFLVAASETASKRESSNPLEYMRICRGLSAGEIVLLIAIHKIDASGKLANESSAYNWCNYLAQNSGLNHFELVEEHEAGLIKRRLITDRTYADRSHVIIKEGHRLTSLGKAICAFIETYKKI